MLLAWPFWSASTFCCQADIQFASSSSSISRPQYHLRVLGPKVCPFRNQNTVGPTPFDKRQHHSNPYRPLVQRWKWSGGVWRWQVQYQGINSIQKEGATPMTKHKTPLQSLSSSRAAWKSSGGVWRWQVHSRRVTDSTGELNLSSSVGGEVYIEDGFSSTPGRK